MKIEKYNQIVWAIIGTAVLIGVLLVMVASPLSFFWGRQRQKGIKVEQFDQKETGRNPEEIVVYSNPIVMEDSEYIMIPVRLKDKKSGFGKSRLSEYASYRGRYNNIIFYNKNNGQSHLLLNKKAIISSFYFPNKKEYEKDKPVLKFLLFGISENDTNGDGIINERDAVIVYLSDLAGKNLQQITPKNTQLIDWEIDENSDMIFLRIRKDSDNDGQFTERDSITVLKVNVQNPIIGTEITTDKIQKKVKSIIR